MFIKCLVCQKEFKTYWCRKNKKYCSNYCRGLKMRGDKPWISGKKHGEDTKQKMSLIKKLAGVKPPSRRGIKWSDSQRQKFTKKVLGHKVSEETKKKISESRLGPKHWFWKGGITPLRVKIWVSKEYQQWRTMIFKRDKYTCKKCKRVGGILNVDHYPISFAQILKDFKIKTLNDAIKCKQLWDISNGRTLCLDCHKKTPNYLKRYAKY